jgi:hypothetical protein
MDLERWFLMPVVLHFFMTAGIAIVLGRKRFKAVRSGRVKRDDILNNTNNWPDDVLKFGRNFDNQFQIPILWYALTAFSMIMKSVDPILVLMSWIFLGLRVFHTSVHIGPNTLPLRFYAFVGGFVLLIIMWLWFAVRIFVTG